MEKEGKEDMNEDRMEVIEKEGKKQSDRQKEKKKERD